MELTIMLAKVFGIYLIVGGLACMIRRQYFMSVMRDFVEHRLLRFFIAIAEFIAGLFLIYSHNYWTSFPEGLVSFFGWALALEGAFYLFMPDKVVRWVIRTFNTKAWYIGGGIVSIVAGLYLVNFAYNFLTL